MSTSRPLAAMPNDCEVHVVFRGGEYTLELRPKTPSCGIRVVLQDRRYGLRLHPKARPSVQSLQTLCDRDLSTLATHRLQPILEDTWHALDGVERAAVNPTVLSAAQAADKRTAVLAEAHRRVLNLHTAFLVLLARTPTDFTIHEAAPPELADEEDDDYDDDGNDDEDDEDEAEEDDGEEVDAKAGDGEEDGDDGNEGDDGDDGDDEDSDDNDDNGGSDDGDEETGGDRGDNPGNAWWDAYVYAKMCEKDFARHHGRQGPLNELLECLVFWDGTRPFPEALVRMFMSKRRASPREERAAEPSVADFLQPLVDASIVHTSTGGNLYMPPWFRYYCQRRMRSTGRLRSVFATTLRHLAGLKLRPLKSLAVVWDGHEVRPGLLTLLAYMKLLVPYGKEEDGSAEWQQLGRVYQERQKQGVPVALQECPLESLGERE